VIVNGNCNNNVGRCMGSNSRVGVRVVMYGRCKGRCNSMGRCKGRCNSKGRIVNER
jgi:hypothetical protein